MLKTLSTVITKFDGTPWKAEDGKTDLTMAHVILNVLGATFEDEKGLNDVEKMKRFFLAERVYSAGATPTEVTPEDVVLVWKLVAKAYSPFIVGWIWRYLEIKESSNTQTISNPSDAGAMVQ